jgi:hypothetical protein
MSVCSICWRSSESVTVFNASSSRPSTGESSCPGAWKQCFPCLCQFRRTRAFAFMPSACDFEAVLTKPKIFRMDWLSTAVFRNSSMGMLGRRCSRLQSALYACRTSTSSRIPFCIFIIIPNYLATTYKPRAVGSWAMGANQTSKTHHSLKKQYRISK